MSATTLERGQEAAVRSPGRANAVLLAATVVFVASLLLAWQRTCVGVTGDGGDQQLCFSVRGWQGNAALLGWLAAAAAIGILVVAVRRGLNRFGASAAHWALVGTFLASAFLKWLFSQGAASTIGCWIGGLAVATAIGAAVVVARRRWAAAEAGARGWLVAAAAVPVVIVLVAGIAYQATGLGRWGGPLAVGYFSEAGGAGVGLVVPVGRNIDGGGATFIRNESGLTATLDGVELVDPTRGVRLVDAVLRGCDSERCAIGGGQVVRPDDPRTRPMDGAELPPKPASNWDLAFIPVVRVAGQGAHHIDGFFVRYSVGPFHYRVYVDAQVDLCGFTPGDSRSRQACETDLTEGL